MAPGAELAFRAVIEAKQASEEEASTALRRDTTARITFTGWPSRAGKSYSGLRFELAIAPEEEEGDGGVEFAPGVALLFGELTCTP